MEKIGFLDWIIYCLFEWRWGKVFEQRPDLRESFASWVKTYDGMGKEYIQKQFMDYHTKSTRKTEARYGIVKLLQVVEVKLIHEVLLDLVTSYCNITDDTVDALFQCDNKLPDLVDYALDQEKLNPLPEHYWYIIMRSIGKSKLAIARELIEKLKPKSSEGYEDAMDEIEEDTQNITT